MGDSFEAHPLSLWAVNMASSFLTESIMNKLISRLPHLSDAFVFRSTLLLWLVALFVG